MAGMDTPAPGTTWTEDATGTVWSETTGTDAVGRHRLVHRRPYRPGVTIEDWLIITDEDLHSRFTRSTEGARRAAA